MQRLANEHKYKLVKLEHVFVTSASWNNLGGIPGLLLTIQDVGVPKVHVHGPNGTVDIFDAIKKFVLLQALKIHEAKCDESKPYSDGVMTVAYVSIAKSDTQETDTSIDMGEEIVDNINYYDYINSNRKRVSDTVAEKETKIPKVEKKLEKVKISNVMSYICKLKPRSGKLCLTKCSEKGVPSGPLLGQLKNGQDVTLPDGTVVYSKDVCHPMTPGPVFISE